MAEFALHILKLNIISAVIIFLVLGLAVVLKNRFTARWKYVVWFAVAVSLLIPVRLPSDISLIKFRVPGIKNSGNEIIAAKQTNLLDANSAKVNSADKADEDTKSQNMTVINKTSADVVLTDQTYYRAKSVALSGGHIVPLAAEIFLVVWLAGAVVKLLAELCAYYFSMKNLKRMSIPACDLMKWKMYRDVCEQKRIRRRPELMQNAGLSTPLLAGLFRTKLYLPAVGYSAEELKLVYRHELTHYLHKDLWYKMILRICASVYWFNPALLIMLWEADKDIENLCDAEVVRVCSAADHKLYRKLLLRTVAIDNQVPYVTASLNDSSMVFKERILYMLNMKKLRKNILPGIILAIVLVGGNLAFGFSGEVISGAQSVRDEGKSDGQDSAEKGFDEDSKKRELVDMMTYHKTSDDQQMTEKENMSEDSTANKNDLNSNVKAENAIQEEIEGQNQTGVNTSDGTGENSTGQNSVPGNSGDGSSNTDDNGNSGDNNVNKTVINTDIITLKDSSGNMIEVERKIYADYSRSYRGYDGMEYTTDDTDFYFTDENGNAYSALNDATHYFGKELEQYTLTSSDGNTITVTETTNGDYYYRDDDGTGYSDNGDGTWTDENGNMYTE